MPNWCSNSVTIVGDRAEVEQLNRIMEELENRQEPSISNGFGTTWLGCLVDALGESTDDIYCRGEWMCRTFEEGELRFEVESAWSPSTEVFDLIEQKFESLKCYYVAEEPGMCIYVTNDASGEYYSERYKVDMCLPCGEDCIEYFEEKQQALDYISKLAEEHIGEEGVERLNNQWQEESYDAYCYLYEFDVVE